MFRTSLFILAAIMLFAAPAPVAAEEEADRADRWVSPTLTRFRSEREFLAYVRHVLGEDSDASSPPPLPPPPPPPPPLPAAPGTAPATPSPPTVVSSQEVRLTGTTRTEDLINSLPQTFANNPAITNVQEVGVDEGDIVKQVGRFLLVLQDGRLFSIDLLPTGTAGLALVDRANVYREPDEDTWYDEMLVFGNRILITGYSYDLEASQLSVFAVDEHGRLSREATFLISSNDYYEEENYATRLVGDNLVIYTPLWIGHIDLDEKWEWPVVRRWRPDYDRERPPPGQPLIDATSIFRPVVPTANPVIHTVSVCPLRAAGSGRDLRCRSTAVIADDDSEFYVTPTHAYLWAAGDHEWPDEDCPADIRPTADEAVNAFVYRLPHSRNEASIVGVRGMPVDRMSMAVIGENFHALSRWTRITCWASIDSGTLAFTTIPMRRFGSRLRELDRSSYTELPTVGPLRLENRFTDTHLVYGGRTGGSFPPEEPIDEPSPLVVVPVAEPAAARVLQAPHAILRAERVGGDVVLTGYRDRTGLNLSLVDLDGQPHIASTVLLPGRFETEGRSHAFNSRIEADGSALLGIPTAPLASEAGRWVWRSGASDISFVTLAPSGALAGAGELLRNEEPGDTGYVCEVSCIDWYGNSRPIFTGGRTFALIGTELVEGRLSDGQIREVRRVDLTAAPAN